MTTPTQAQIDAAEDLVGKWFVWLWATQASWMKSMPDQATKDDLINRIAALTAAAEVEVLQCTGCGCRLSIEELRKEHPRALSCCPERDMQTPKAATIERCAQVLEAMSHDCWLGSEEDTTAMERQFKCVAAIRALKDEK